MKNLTQSTLRRWGPWLALVVLFSIATSLLSWWQFSRREERVQKINTVIENYDKFAVPFADLDWELFENGEPINEWRPVTVSGTYLTEEAVLVRNRPLSGQGGFLQLVPLLLDDGQILIVDRGWLATGVRVTEASSNPLPNPVAHTLTVRLRAAEPDLNRAPVPGQLASVNPALLFDQLSEYGTVVSDRYGRLAAESPSYENAPFPMPMPSLNEGNHLSYAFQWIIFGIMAFIAFGWAYRNERRIAREAAGQIAPRKPKENQALEDAEFEDANQ
jgi:cytochrome oxidase assembly protein ShyY1